MCFLPTGGCQYNHKCTLGNRSSLLLYTLNSDHCSFPWGGKFTCHFSYLSDNILTPGLSETPHSTRPWDYSGGGCQEPRAQPQASVTAFYDQRAQSWRGTMQTAQRVRMGHIPGPLLSGCYPCSRWFSLGEDLSLKLGFQCRSMRHWEEKPRSPPWSCHIVFHVGDLQDDLAVL